MTDWMVGIFAMIGVVAAIWCAIAGVKAADEAKARKRGLRW